MSTKTIPGIISRIFTAGTKRETAVNRKVKDRLFRFIFENDKEALLQLYNALNGTDYKDTADIEIVTLEDIVYMSMKNDVAFIIAEVLNLYEHQSTLNPNMPLRLMLYLGQEYQKIITMRQHNIYGTKKIRMPVPRCVVFYNGSKDLPDEQTLYLSDSFESTEGNSSRKTQSDVELKVHMLNINYGHNMELMEKCRRLQEYAYFIDRINQNLKEGFALKKAVDQAVLHCIENDILADILEPHRMEVRNMLLAEYDEKKTMGYLQKEAQEEGIAKGIKEGIERVNILNKLLIRDNRIKDLKYSSENKEFQQQLFIEYGIGQEEY